jgi:hypothetical protein
MLFTMGTIAFLLTNFLFMPIPVTALSRHWSAAARLLGLWVRIPPANGCLSLVSVVCCQVEVSAMG